jgi:hypothetical protein
VNTTEAAGAASRAAACSAFSIRNWLFTFTCITSCQARQLVCARGRRSPRMPAFRSSPSRRGQTVPGDRVGQFEEGLLVVILRKVEGTAAGCGPRRFDGVVDLGQALLVASQEDHGRAVLGVGERRARPMPAVAPSPG